MNACRFSTLRKVIVALLLCNLANLSPLLAGGVTVITHGLNGNVDDWVTAMGERIAAYDRFPGTNYSCYKLYFSGYALTWTRVHGDPPASTDSGEIVVLLDWGPLAGGNDYDTYDVAALVINGLLMTNFISELGGHALAELPLHLIGHSRGGSLVCQISQLLGTNGIWVDHLTTLDPHPLNNDGFFDFIYRAVDAPCRTYENVLFHDNYYQFISTLIYGEPVGGAYQRQLTSLDGGYSGFTGPHSDVHLWYHGTIDARVPASDYAATINSAERQSWWTAAESSGASAGLHYSQIGRGNRLSTNRPVTAATARIIDGYNQLWDLGAGASNNRTLLPENNGNWPNLIKFNLTGTNVAAIGQSNTVRLHYQWAQPSFSNATVNIYLDNDLNPFNANESFVRQVTAAGTGPSQVSSTDIGILLDIATATPGPHTLYAEIKGNGRTRFLYAPEILTVINLERPTLQIRFPSPSQTQVDVLAAPGQRIVLQSTTDLSTWQSLATNTLSTGTWTFIDTRLSRKFYRALLQ